MLILAISRRLFWYCDVKVNVAVRMSPGRDLMTGAVPLQGRSVREVAGASSAGPAADARLTVLSWWDAAGAGYSLCGVLTNLLYQYIIVYACSVNFAGLQTLCCFL